ncbi:MAG: hypothetical protein EOO78_37215, partial [Oxalobacteraceae bacterium]
TTGRCPLRPAPAAPCGRSCRSGSAGTPRTPVEETLCGIWATLLKLERVGVNDNFFELGGHSLLLVKLHAAVEAVFPERLAISDYFKYTSIALLADQLDPTRQAAAADARMLRDDARKNRRAMQQATRQKRADQQTRG